MTTKPFRFHFNKAITGTITEILHIAQSVLLTPIDPWREDMTLFRNVGIRLPSDGALRHRRYPRIQGRKKHQNPFVLNVIQWAARRNHQRQGCTIFFIQGLWEVTWPSSFVTRTSDCRLKCASLGSLHNFNHYSGIFGYIYYDMLNDVDQATSIWQPVYIHFCQTICRNDVLSSFCADGRGLISLSRTGEGQTATDLLVF
jgi:hypothetical protein